MSEPSMRGIYVPVDGRALVAVAEDRAAEARGLIHQAIGAAGGPDPSGGSDP